MKKGILGIKLGMTQVFGDKGEAIPVTVIQAGPCMVVQKKTVDSDGYNAIQVGMGEAKERRVNKPLAGHFHQAGVKPYRFLRELPLEDVSDFQVGQEIRVDIFQPGDLVDVIGTSKGKGFAGGIKRHGFHRGPMEHGSKYHRRPGSAAAKGPARVFKGRRLPGHLGAERVTVQNLQVVRTDAERNIILVRGAVPGPIRSLVAVRDAVKYRGR